MFFHYSEVLPHSSSHPQPPGAATTHPTPRAGHGAAHTTTGATPQPPATSGVVLGSLSSPCCRLLLLFKNHGLPPASVQASVRIPRPSPKTNTNCVLFSERPSPPAAACRRTELSTPGRAAKRAAFPSCSASCWAAGRTTAVLAPSTLLILVPQKTQQWIQLLLGSYRCQFLQRASPSRAFRTSSELFTARATQTSVPCRRSGVLRPPPDTL